MRRLAFVACLATIGIAARADVVTNTWITPGGGDWFASATVVSTNAEVDVEVVTTNVVYTNWQDGKNCISTNVAYFPLASGATISANKDADGKNAAARLDGLVMLPAEPDGTMTNIWWVKNDGNSSFHTYTSSLGYCPFNVSGGTLVMGNNSLWVPEDKGPVRKEGDGIIRISSFYRQLHSRREFQVAEGKLIPMVQDALFWTDVRVTDPAGQFVFTNFSSRVGVGSLRSGSRTSSRTSRTARARACCTSNPRRAPRSRSRSTISRRRSRRTPRGTAAISWPAAP